MGVDMISLGGKQCPNCSGTMQYSPGSKTLQCPYCRYEERIGSETRTIEELELSRYIDLVGDDSHGSTLSLIQCKHCGAEQHVEEQLKSMQCTYCNSPLIKEEAYEDTWIKPNGIQPFVISEHQAIKAFHKWTSRLWFLPNKFKRASLQSKQLNGVYFSFWTFDCNAESQYSGQRGEAYYETRIVRANGEKKRVQERKIKWYPVQGNVSGFIDDILIPATYQTETTPPFHKIRMSTKDLLPYDKKFLSGYVTMIYNIPLKEGHQRAYQEMKKIVQTWIRRDIGGDAQKIISNNLQIHNETFKHVLMPFYTSGYQYNGKQYPFYINGKTGDIYGERPYSYWKIFIAIILGIILALIIALFFQ